MNMVDSSTPKQHLGQISTRWTIVDDPAQFVVRYATAIRGYLSAMLKNADAVEEVLQQFLLHVVETGFAQVSLTQARFRDYLMVCVRNAARTYLRKQKPHGDHEEMLAHFPDPSEPRYDSDEEWLAQWRRCMLDRAWEALEFHQRQTPGNLFYTVLKVASEHIHEDSAALARRVTQSTGHKLKAEAFRKQLSRTRRFFAGLLVQEIAATLENATPQTVEEELIHTGLMDYVGPFLPPEWRTQGKLPGAE